MNERFEKKKIKNSTRICHLAKWRAVLRFLKLNEKNRKKHKRGMLQAAGLRCHYIWCGMTSTHTFIQDTTACLSDDRHHGQFYKDPTWKYHVDYTSSLEKIFIFIWPKMCVFFVYISFENILVLYPLYIPLFSYSDSLFWIDSHRNHHRNEKAPFF
jgi:hypothetical protein